MTDLLVIAPHPDDEVLGCGATMARYLREGKSVAVVWVGEGGWDKAYKPTEDHSTLVFRAMLALGPGVHTGLLRFSEDQRFETHPRAVLADEIAGYVGRWQPRTVLLPFYGDVNLDHRVTFEAAMVACRPTRSFIRRIACYETASSTEWGAIHPFRPNWYVEVSADDLRRKNAALEVYGDQMREPPHPRNVQTAHTRIMARGSEVCAQYAEAFQLVREVDRL